MYPSWVAPFLASLRRKGVVAQAARDADVIYSAVYALRGKDGDFAAAWTDALEESYDALEAELLDRAVHGVAEPLTYQGQFTYEFERDERGNPVLQAIEVQVRDSEGNARTEQQYRPKLLLGPDGKPVVAAVRKKSDALLMFALKGRRKRVYADRTELSGPDGAPVQLDEGTRAARIAQLMALAQQRKDWSDLA